MEQGKWTWVNGKIIPSQKAVIPVGCQWTQYGIGCFEGIRCYKTPKGLAIFRLHDHLQRFHFSLKTLNIKPRYSVTELEEAIKLTVRKNEFEECYIRPCAGHISRKIGLHSEPQDTVGYFITVWNWPTYFSKPICAKISPFIRPHPKSLEIRAKTCGTYINSFLAELDAETGGFNSAILLDDRGYVAEMPTSNIFLVMSDGDVETPPKRSILPGITRNTILNLCWTELNCRVEEMYLVTMEKLKNAKEIFVCGTAAEITPVVEIDYGDGKKKVGNGKPGPVTKKLQKLYRKAVTGKLPGYEHWLSCV